MVDLDTFLTTLYVMVDDFCKTHLPPESRPGPAASLTRSEVLTLAIFGQWQPSGSEQGFYRYAQRHLRALPNQLGQRLHGRILLCHPLLVKFLPVKFLPLYHFSPPVRALSA